jgi:adenine-specific DNA-methyltransferase
VTLSPVRPQSLLPPSEPLQNFQDLLRRLFQFEHADLDFGIYRILNQKHAAITKFIEKDLPSGVARALQSGTLGRRAQLAEELASVAKQVRVNLGDDALDGDGNLTPEQRNTPLGRTYLELLERAGRASSQADLEVLAFNHLYAFFSRYYDAGDFMSKRRYSRAEKYAVPYNGEEVLLHWANKDQYYVKTTEYFTTYRFAVRDVRVRFELARAQLDPDNVKGEKRFFVPVLKSVRVDDGSGEAVIPFEYRALSEQETVRFGGRNQQESINEEAGEAIPKRFKAHVAVVEALISQRRVNANGEPVTQLEHHLLQYTRRNTADYFIHKDLGGFLTRELDFFLKNEVLNVDDLLAGSGEASSPAFELARAIQAVGGQIITFVAQIENFQKRLFEKRKFVLAANYCVAVSLIPDASLEAVLSCESQWQEWMDQFALHETDGDLYGGSASARRAKRHSFVKTHPSLLLDTKHFSSEFTDELLKSFENLDEMTDGVLIHGENFQALNLLTERLKGRVRCVYIDPPYNSKTTEILYKNTYKHSSWLSLMQDRLLLSRRLAGPFGVHVVAIDENESERLGLLLRSLFPDSAVTAVSVIHNPRGIQGDNFSYSHEYAYFVYPQRRGAIALKVVPQEQWEFANLRNWGGESERGDGKTCFYPIIVKGDKIVEIGDVPDDQFHPRGQNVSRKDGSIEVWPIDRNGVERKWRYARGSLESVLHATRVKRDGEKVEIELARSVEMRRTVWGVRGDSEGSPYDASVHGTQLLSKIVPDAFSFPKSLYTVTESLQAAGCGDGDYIVDYFAGSGTTGHAAIYLNRQDGARRKFVLVEMGQYFDTVLLPRLKKIAYTPEWNAARPQRVASMEEAQRRHGTVHHFWQSEPSATLLPTNFGSCAMDSR